LDHCGGLAPLLFGMKHAPQTHSRTRPLRIFACAGTRKLLEAIDNAHNYKLSSLPFPLEFNEISANDSPSSFAPVRGVTATTLSTPHRAESPRTTSHGRTRHDVCLHFGHRVFGRCCAVCAVRRFVCA
jgi:hypothetical protein